MMYENDYNYQTLENETRLLQQQNSWTMDNSEVLPENDPLYTRKKLLKN